MTKSKRITKHVPAFLAVEGKGQQIITPQGFVSHFYGESNEPDVFGCDFSHRRGGLTDNRRGGNQIFR